MSGDWWKGGPHRGRTAAFTLIELLMAIVIFGIVLASMNTVFYGALRLRNRTVDTVDAAQALNQTIGLLRRDLQNALPPGTRLAPSFKIGPVTAATGTEQSPGIEFFCTTGIVDDTAPWGDVQRVVYQLREAEDVSRAAGRDLVRSVTRNLLATGTQEALAQRLMTNVEALEFQAYNGTEWRPTWDTTLTETNLPSAVRVRLLLAATNLTASFTPQPIELIVPLVMQAVVNTNQTSGGGQ